MHLENAYVNFARSLIFKLKVTWV